MPIVGEFTVSPEVLVAAVAGSFGSGPVGIALAALGANVIKNVIENADKHAIEDTGVAQPTTFMPTGQFTSVNDLIRFDGYPENDHRRNFGVGRNFACGLNPSIPSSYPAKPADTGEQLADTDEQTVVEQVGPYWFFIDQSNPTLRKKVKGTDPLIPGHPSLGTYASEPGIGYYLAVYQDIEDGQRFGFLEAYDVGLHPVGLEFEQFKNRIRERYVEPNVRFSLVGINSYVMSDGSEIQFQIAPISQVIRSNSKRLTEGDILTSDLGDDGNNNGRITIRNPIQNKQIVLDFRDWNSPRREPPRE